MFTNVDSEEQIVLAQIAYILEKYSYRVISRNGEGESLLRCAGLSNLLEEYAQYLQPYWYNGHYKNSNSSFNPGYVITKVCNTIESNKRVLGNFLNEFLRRIRKIDDEDITKIKNYLELLGYNLNVQEVEDDYEVYYNYSLSPYSDGVIERQQDISFMVGYLNNDYSDLTYYYEEAISTYGNSEYKSCIDNCRTLIEKFFQKQDSSTNSHIKGILNLTGESILHQGAQLESIRKIFSYWVDERKGANRFRLFITMYSVLSGLGPHGEEIPSKEDALMCLRMTEDIIIWCFQHNN